MSDIIMGNWKWSYQSNSISKFLCFCVRETTCISWEQKRAPNSGKGTEFKSERRQTNYVTNPRCIYRLEKLFDPPLKKPPAFYVTWMISVVWTTVCQLTVSSARLIRSTCSNSIKLKLFLILSIHLYLRLQQGFLPSSFPTKFL